MSYEVRRLDPDDFNHLEPQKAQKADVEYFDGQVDWDAYFHKGFALTALRNKKPIAIGGVVQCLPGIGECWTVIGEHATQKDILRLYRSFSRVLHSELETAYHRLQMYVDADFEQGVRLARLLKMKKEGIARGYPRKGKWAVLFARCSDD